MITSLTVQAIWYLDGDAGHFELREDVHRQFADGVDAQQGQGAGDNQHREAVVEAKANKFIHKSKKSGLV